LTPINAGEFAPEYARRPKPTEINALTGRWYNKRGEQQGRL